MAQNNRGTAAFIWSAIGLALLAFAIYSSPIAVLSAVGGVIVLAVSPARERVADSIGNGLWAAFGAFARLKLPGRGDRQR